MFPTSRRRGRGSAATFSHGFARLATLYGSCDGNLSHDTRPVEECYSKQRYPRSKKRISYFRYNRGNVGRLNS